MAPRPETTPAAPAPPPPPPGHGPGERQPDTLPMRTIGLAGAAILGTVALVAGGVLGWLHLHDVPPGGEPFDRAELQQVPRPRLQSAPQPDLAAWREAQAAKLARRGWQDPAAGIARIPVDEAMTMVLARSASTPALRAASSAAGQGSGGGE